MPLDRYPLPSAAFDPFWYLYVFWVPWDRLASFFKAGLPASLTARAATA